MIDPLLSKTSCSLHIFLFILSLTPVWTERNLKLERLILGQGKRCWSSSHCAHPHRQAWRQECWVWLEMRRTSPATLFARIVRRCGHLAHWAQNQRAPDSGLLVRRPMVIRDQFTWLEPRPQLLPKPTAMPCSPGNTTKWGTVSTERLCNMLLFEQ